MFWAFCGLTVAVSVPFWVVEFLPLLDIPQHLATIAVMHHLDDPEYGYAAYFTIEAGSTQYLLYYLTCDLLSTVLGVETANRVFLSLYAILLPASVLWFLHAFDRVRAAALLAFPLVFNKFLFYGFINYVFALPFFFFGLGLLRRALDDERTRPWREALLVGASLLVFYSHLQIFLIYAGATGLLVLMRWPGLRAFFVRQLHMVFALVLFAIWGFGSSGLASGRAWEEQVSHRYESLTGSDWEPLIAGLRGIPDRLLSVYRDGADEALTVTIGVLILLLVMLRRLGREPHASRRAWIGSLFPEVLTLFVIGFYVLVPTGYKWVWPVNWRFLPVAVLLLLTWGDARPDRWVRGVLTVGFATVAIWSIVVHTRRFRAFDAEAQSVSAVLDVIEPQSRVYSLVFDSGSPIIELPVYLHFVQYHQLRKGGVSVYSFAEAPQSPVRFRLRREGGPPPTPLRSEWRANEFRYNTDARYYDYLMVRGEPSGFRFRARLPKGELEKVYNEPPWTLYRYDRAPQ